MPKLPLQLLNSLSKLNNFDVKAFEAVHESDDRLTSIRLNPFKKTELDFKTATPVAWNEFGFYLDERPYFTHDPLFHAGCYYVQEAGSMFLELALKQNLDLTQPLKILDLCAAPGGKSTLINSLLSPESLLVANETVKSRADVLAQNLGRWGTANCIVTNNYPERFSGLENYFDALIVDAPCSGSGLFRKQPEAINEWSEDAVNACGLRQKSILSDCLPALKSGGFLFYSTCSYSTEENEDLVNWLIQEHGLEYQPLNVNKDWGIIENEAGYRFYPHLTKSEGFFCALLKKPYGGIAQNRQQKISTSITRPEIEILSQFLNPESGSLHKINGRIHIVNEAVLGFLAKFDKTFYFKKAGTLIGEIKGGKLVPEQELAWSIHTGNGFEVMELNKAEAINYLKKQNFLTGVHKQNLVLLRYQGYGLGWAKILPNRVNNYLPNELRIIN